MSLTIYASFFDPIGGKKAAGALLDHGVLNDELSLVVSESYLNNNPHYWATAPHDDTPKNGITTTTASDASSGAAQGAGVGLVLGILGALVSLAIPGFGIVIGGGALATAVGSAAATTAAGAVAGGVTGYLKDQGVADEDAATYQRTLLRGGAILTVHCPSGPIEQREIETLLVKYGAVNLRYSGLATLASSQG